MAKRGCAVRQDGSRRSIFEWARFPEVGPAQLSELVPSLANLDVDLRAEILEDAHYDPYLERQQGELSELSANEAVRLPSFLNYRAIAGLHLDMVEWREAARPETLRGEGGNG